MKADLAITIARVSDSHHIWPALQFEELERAEIIAFLKEAKKLLDATIELQEARNVRQ
jgi:hypothetical protein